MPGCKLHQRDTGNGSRQYLVALGTNDWEPMPKLSAAWSKLRWSIAQRGLGRTLSFALQRGRRPSDDKRSTLHPFDQRYGVDTSGLIGGGELRSGHKNDVFNTAYYGMAPSRFHHVIASWIADDSHPSIVNYSFVDLGCGKGRAIMMASESAFRQVIGVELHRSLARIAKNNVTIWAASGRAVSPIHVVCQDALDFVFPYGHCLLYLFNPFTAPVLTQLIERISDTFAERPGMLDLIYFNPQDGGLIDAHPGFKLLWSGTVALSEEDAAVDWVASPEDICSVYRWVGPHAEVESGRLP
jgi:SAM-dependent methyltransferase